MRQAEAVDYGSHLPVPVPVAMSSGEAEYISATVACMKTSHIRMLKYDFKHLGTKSYDLNNPLCKPLRIIINNETAIANSKSKKDTAGNRHVARRYHYVRQGTSLKEHKFEWIGKNWYKNFDTFLTSNSKFQRSRVKGCLYIYRKERHWIKMINICR